MATLTLAPLVIVLFYSSKFQEAVEVLRWLCLGMALRVISWPMGFIIIAKGAQSLFFWSELAWTVVLHCTRMDLRDCFLLEWRRHCLFLLIHFPCPYYLLNR